MKRLSILSLVLAAGCASSPEYVAGQSNFNVCRLTMGGPHARAADAEAARRGLDCRQYYGAIQQQLANENAATNAAIRALRPQPTPAPAPRAPVNCTSRVIGNTVQTDCW